MNLGWLIAVFLLAFLDWYAVWMEKGKLNWITKPATVLALLMWLGFSSGFEGKLLWFGLALLFGLAGDIFLLLPQQFFLLGLAAFLLGHLAYGIGFWFEPLEFRLPHYLLLLLLGCVLFMAAPPILKGMQNKDSARKLKISVLFYMLMISFMVFMAVSTLFRPDWKIPAAGLAVSGALLFFCSDTLLAYREFVEDFPKARFWVRVTYHLAQIALTASAVLNYAS